jgi:hypothetical protein
MYTYCLLKGVRDTELFICYGASIDRAEWCMSNSHDTKN